MANIKLTNPPELQTKVAESCEPETKQESFDLAELLDLPKKVVEAPEKVVEPQPENPEKVVESKQVTDTPKKKSGSKYEGYTQKRAEANGRWEKKQARINLRMAPELKAEIEEHTKARRESIMGFIIRAIKEQIERDSRKPL